MNAIIGFTTLALSNIDDTDRVKDYLGKTLASRWSDRIRQYPLRMFSELPHAVKRPAAEIAAGRL